MNDSAADHRSKEVRLEALAKTRRETGREGYKNVGDYCDGRYDCDFVSPYTKCAPNVDSQIFIMLQDWAGDDFLCEGFREDIRRCGTDGAP